MKDIKNVIGVRLKTLQEKRGVSNVELATATDINKASISQYRSGSREPDAESLVKIAKYFNVSVDYLLGINDIESANITEQEICKRMHLTKDALDAWLEIKGDKDSVDLVVCFIKMLSQRKKTFGGENAV